MRSAPGPIPRSRFAAPAQRPGAAERDQQADNEAEASEQHRPAARACVGRAEHRFAEDDVAEQAVEEEGAALLRAQPAGLATFDAEGAGEGAGQAVDGRAFLRRRSEIDAAEQRRPLALMRRERLADEFGDRRADGGELRRERADERAAVQVRLGLQPGQHALLEHADPTLGFRGERRDGVLNGALPVGQGDAPHLLARFPVEVAEELGEAGEKVGFGQQCVDGEAHAELGLEFGDAAADRPCVQQPVGAGGVADHVGERDGDDDAVERLFRPGPLEQVEEGLPARPVDGGVGIVGGVAARCVDQHGFVGEPPLAQPGAADAGERAAAHLLGQREFEAGVEQRGGLAGAGRPDDDVPGLLVDGAALAARLAQRRHRRAELLLQRRGLGVGRLAAGDPAASERSRLMRRRSSARLQIAQKAAMTAMMPIRGSGSSSSGRSGPTNHTTRQSNCTPMKLRNQRRMFMRPSLLGLPRQHDVDAPVQFAAFRGGVGRDRVRLGASFGGEPRFVADGAGERVADRFGARFG